LRVWDALATIVAAVIADVVADNLADLAGDKDPAMSLDLQGWRSSDRGEMGDLDFTPALGGDGAVMMVPENLMGRVDEVK
jgi:hypothetical protein